MAQPLHETAPISPNPRPPRADLRAQAASNAIQWAHESLQLTYPELGKLLDVSRRTVMRWAQQKNSPRSASAEKLEDLYELRHLLEIVFPDEASANEWLNAPVPMLRGRTPISRILDGQLSDVVEVLATLESGAFA